MIFDTALAVANQLGTDAGMELTALTYWPGTKSFVANFGSDDEVSHVDLVPDRSYNDLRRDLEYNRVPYEPEEEV